jgi:AcrR family transcriptional regulator
MNQADLRVVRSKKMIKEAFLELIAEKGYKNVTIKDIAERAMVNRKTFYNRYESIDALFHEILNETTKLILINPAQACRQADPNGSCVDLYDEIRTFLTNLSSNKRTLNILFNDISSFELNRQIERGVQSYVLERLADSRQNSFSANKYPIKLLACLITSVFIVVIRWWLIQEDYSEEDAARILVDIISDGFIQSLGLN